MDFSKVYTSLDEILQDSQIVVEVKLTEKSEEIAYEGANFILSQVQIIDVVKGDPSYKDREIKIFEVKSFNIDSHNNIMYDAEEYKGEDTFQSRELLINIDEFKEKIKTKN